MCVFQKVKNNNSDKRSKQNRMSILSIFSILILTCLVCSFLNKYLWAWQTVFHIVCSHTESVSCIWLQIRDYKLCIIPIIQQLCHRTRLSCPLTWKPIFYFSIELLWLFPRNTNCCCVQSLGREILWCWRHWKNNIWGSMKIWSMKRNKLLGRSSLILFKNHKNISFPSNPWQINK